MKNLLLASTVVLASVSLSSAAYACDMHGAGFGGYGLRNAPWQTYSPKVPTTDPAFAEDDMMTFADRETVPEAKPKPSFSNVANMAAIKAKARLAKKDDDKTSDKKAPVKKAALNADR